MQRNSVVDWMLRPFCMEVPDFSVEFSDLINERTSRMLARKTY